MTIKCWLRKPTKFAKKFKNKKNYPNSEGKKKIQQKDRYPQTTTRTLPFKIHPLPVMVHKNTSPSHHSHHNNFCVNFKSDKTPRRPWNTLSGLILYGGYNFLPFLMFYIYYKAICGNILCIVLSLAQLIYQKYATRQFWFQRFLRFFEGEKYFDDYTLHFEEKIDPTHSLLGVHPHNIVVIGILLNLYSGRFGDLLLCATRVLTDMPLLGLLHKLGGITSANPDNLKYQMGKGQNLALLPGGFEESTISTTKENRVYITHRKGFIKYAMRYGYKIYPLFIFGENQMYQTLDRFENFRLGMNKVKVFSALFWSRFGFIPECHCEIHTVVGKAIVLPKIENPSNELIDKYHAIYMEKLLELFNRHKKQFKEKADLKVY